ncbi:MAG: hypothetical protein JSS62_06845 [Verrucomicrobia bacterium]|nr:hypothetical protein [Verrucomicrobiota bacterium]MBS0645154.1 hypothetical protein [Verrucomicrobiota bacterium]
MSSGAGGTHGSDQESFFQSLLAQQALQQRQQTKQQQVGQQQDSTLETTETTSRRGAQTVRAGQPATTKDAISSARSSTMSGLLEDTQTTETPKLVSPSALRFPTSSATGAQAPEFSEFSDLNQIAGPEKYVSLIVIMAAVLLAQAKMSSNFWQTLFKEGTSQMQASIQLAPEIAKATKQEWDAQADISESEASMSLSTAITSMAGFALSMGAGALGGSAAEDTENAAEEDSSATLTSEAGEEGAADSTEMEDMSESATQGTSESESAATKGAKQVTKGLSKASKILKVLQNSTTYSQMFLALTQGINAAVDYVYKMKIAKMQQEVGQWKAVEEQLQIGVQFFQQAFGRTDNLTQASEQNLQKSLDILSQVASSIANAISQGFNKVV